MVKKSTIELISDMQRVNELILAELRDIKKHLAHMPTRIKVARLSNTSKKINSKIIKSSDLISIYKDNFDHVLKKGSELYRVRQILRKSGKSAHVEEIMQALGTSDKGKKASLVGSLNRYSKQGKVFIKTDRNTFGLREFLKRSA